jgi:hypothetical protein
VIEAPKVLNALIVASISCDLITFLITLLPLDKDAEIIALCISLFEGGIIISPLHFEL